MKCFSFFLLFMALSSISQKDFVEFNEEEIVISRDHEEVQVIFGFNILDGFYIQDNLEVPDNIIPTEVNLIPNDDFEIMEYEIIPKANKDIILDENIHKVISESFEVKVNLRLKGKASHSSLKGQITYQACNERQCFYPRDLSFSVAIN